MGGYRCDKINAGAPAQLKVRDCYHYHVALIFNDDDNGGVVWLEKRER